MSAAGWISEARARLAGWDGSVDHGGDLTIADELLIAECADHMPSDLRRALDALTAVPAIADSLEHNGGAFLNASVVEHQRHQEEVQIARDLRRAITGEEA